MARSTKQVEGDLTVHYVSARAKRERPTPRMQPPMTPMIDVTFQLLLFFLLTTTFRQSEGNIPGTLPQKGHTSAATAAPDILRPIHITIRPTTERDNCIYEISGSHVVIASGEELFKNLKGRQEAIKTDEAPIVIQPWDDVQWQFVVEAFNQSVRARFKNIGFASGG